MAVRIHERQAPITWPWSGPWIDRDGVMGLLASEWKWPLTVALLFTAVLDVPLRLAGLVGAAYGRVFNGMIWAPHDAAQYLSAMR